MKRTPTEKPPHPHGRTDCPNCFSTICTNFPFSYIRWAGNKQKEFPIRLLCKVCVSAGHLQESRGPPSLKSRKSQKAFLGLLARSLEKFQRRSKALQNKDLSAPNHKSQIASDLKSRSPNRKNFFQIAVSAGSNRKSQIARFVIWASVLIAVRIAMRISYTMSQNNELFWEGSTLSLRKILVSVKFLSAILGAGNGCANFMDTWKNALFLQEKPMSIKFLVLGGGGVFGFFLGGGSADFIFMGARIFLSLKSLVMCDSRFESQIAIAIKSRDLEHLDKDTFQRLFGDLRPRSSGLFHSPEVCWLFWDFFRP